VHASCGLSLLWRRPSRARLVFRANHDPRGHPSREEQSINASESLKTFLKGKKQRDEETGRAADKEERIRDRRSAIEELFSKIESWLKSRSGT
jgi:hypothetical protein